MVCLTLPGVSYPPRLRNCHPEVRRRHCRHALALKLNLVSGVHKPSGSYRPSPSTSCCAPCPAVNFMSRYQRTSHQEKQSHPCPNNQAQVSESKPQAGVVALVWTKLDVFWINAERINDGVLPSSGGTI